METAPEGFVGDWAATVELFTLYCVNGRTNNNSVSRQHTEKLLERGANPCWDVSLDDTHMPANYTAVRRGDVEFLRVIHSHWPNIDAHHGGDPYDDDGHTIPLLEFALMHGQWQCAECLFEWGLPCNFLLQPELASRDSVALMCARFNARVKGATLAASALMSRASRRHWTRDVARILARMVWRTRRTAVWEGREWKRACHESAQRAWSQRHE